MPRRRKQAVVEDEPIVDTKSELGETLEAVTKRYGKGTVRRGIDIVQPTRIPTGVFIYDFATLGGIPTNRFSVFVGEKSSGKSMMANRVIASAQRMYPDEVVVMIDAEHTHESTWSSQLGVNNEALTVISAETGEMGADIAEAAVLSKETSLVVVDSLAALVPHKEIEDSVEDHNVALQARLINKMVRKLNAAMIKERKRNHLVTILVLTQFRMSIGGFGPDPRIVVGGKAMEYFTSLQTIIKNKENKKSDSRGIEQLTENEHSFTITKNKLNAGPRHGEFKLIRTYDEVYGLEPGQIKDAHTLVSYSKKFGFYSGGGTKRKLEFDDYSINFKKDEEAIMALYEDPEFYWALRTCLIREQASELGMPESFIRSI